MKERLTYQLMNLFHEAIKDELSLMLPDLIEKYLAKNHEKTSVKIGKNQHIPNLYNNSYLPLNWLLSSNKIETLYSILKNASKITSDFESFKSVFINEYPISIKRKWLGSANEFAYLMGELMSENIIQQTSHQWISLSMSFCKSDGTDFNPRSLSSQYATGKINRSFELLVRKLIETLKGA